MSGVLMPLAMIVLGVIVWMATQAIVAQLRGAREDAARGRALTILQTLAPGIEAARSDPRALLVWLPVARTVRQLFPAESATLDAAAGGAFPFSKEQIASAHARWTTDWLAWERAHDADYKARAALAEQDVAVSGGSAAARARLDAVEREKLDLYQRRYQEYVQIAKALQGLSEPPRADH